jgi:hypothetical protein
MITTRHTTSVNTLVWLAVHALAVHALAACGVGNPLEADAGTSAGTGASAGSGAAGTDAAGTGSPQDSCVVTGTCPGGGDSGMAFDAGAGLTATECLSAALPLVGPQRSCACRTCPRELSDCHDDEGCREISACAMRTGCVGTACYFSQPECMASIDQWGSTSLSTTLAQVLMDCTERTCGPKPAHNCPAEVTSIMDMPVAFEGCCTDGLCGVHDVVITNTCIERSAFPLIPLAALRCYGDDGDAGTE